MLERRWVRQGRARGIVWLATASTAIAVAASWLHASPARAEPPPRAPVWIAAETKDGTGVLAYPPRETRAPRPLMVMLHGMCDVPQRECPAFAGEATSGHWLLCPRANLACEGGGNIWSGMPAVRTSLLDATLESARQRFAGKLDEASGRTLVGFSLGSFVALDVAQRSKGTWRSLILIGAKIEPDARLLAEAGVRNVLLGAGDRDMMKWHMVEQARRLQRRGVRATFLGMGDVGHWFPRDMDRWLDRALAWVNAEAGTAER
jgi:predicted esterase